MKPNADPKNAARPRQPDTEIIRKPLFEIEEEGTSLADIIESGSGHPAGDPDAEPGAEKP